MPAYIKEYSKNNDFCIKCKLAENSPSPFIEGRGNINSKVLVLTDAPTKNDEIMGLAYAGEYGKSIERYVVNAGIRSYYLSYMVKCHPDGKKLQTAKKCCYPFTIALIREMKPRVIIAMGRDVLESLTKVFLDIGVARLKKFYHPELNAIIVPTYNPKIFLNPKTDPLCKINFEIDLAFACQVASEGLPRSIISTPVSLKNPIEIEKYLKELLIAKDFAFDLETQKLYNEETSNILREAEKVEEAIAIDDQSEPSEQTIKDKIEIVSETVDAEAAALESTDEDEDKEDDEEVAEPKLESSIDEITEIPSNKRSKKKMDESHSPQHDKITDISFCMQSGKGVHINWDFLMQNYEELVKEVFQSPARKAGHNGRYDVKFLECVGIPVNNYYFDTMIAYHRLTMSWEGGTAKGLYRLKTMDWFLTTVGGYNEVLDEFGGIKSIQNKKKKLEKKPKKAKKTKGPEVDTFVAEQMTPEQIISIELQKVLEDNSNYVLNKKKEFMNSLGLEPMEYYSAMDSDVTYRIFKRLEPEIDKYCSGFFYNIDMPVNEVFKDMELNGVRLDKDHMLKIYKSNFKKAIESKTKFFEYCGEEFNIGSTQQLQNIMFKKLKIAPDKRFKTKTGNSTNEPALKVYAEKHSELNSILDYRGYLKQNSVYLSGFKDCIDPMTGRAYPSFMQIATATSRIGVTAPALQTMPKDNMMRNMVIPREGWKFVTADLSQAELRMMARLSGDENMINAFVNGFDFHIYTACTALLHIPVSEYNGEIKEHKAARNGAKAINFGIIFLIGAKKLGSELKVSTEEAQGFIDAWFKQYPKVFQWIESTKAFAIKHGYTETLYGRRRYLPLIKSPDMWIREAAIRQAVNCIDAETEALSQRGWLKYNELNKKDLLLTKNKDTGILEWQKINEISIFPDYEGEIIEFKSRSFSAVTTPEHRWLIDNKAEGNTQVVVSKDLSIYGSHKIHRTGKYICDDSKYSDDFVELMGWVLTDGFYERSKTYNNSGVGICQSLRAKPYNVKRIEDLLKRLDLKVYTTLKEHRQCMYWMFWGELAKSIKLMFPERKLTMDFINNISRDQAQLLLETMIRADGIEEPAIGKSSGKRTFYTRHEDVAGIFQILCTMCGFSSSYKWRASSDRPYTSPKLLRPILNSKGVFLVIITWRKMAQIVKHQKLVYSKKMLMWCPSVENTFFVARRAGQVYITGNTPVQSSANDIAFMGLIRTNNFIKKEKLQSEIILVVHDEIIVESPPEEIEIISPKLIEFLTKDVPKMDRVPLVADPCILDKWEK
jgi:uracil-DNA glycosylase family 4